MKVVDIDVQNGILHRPEEGTRQWFCEEIPNHFACWHIFDIDLLSLDAVGDEEVLDVDMLGLFCAGCLPILFEQDARLIVLI